MASPLKQMVNVQTVITPTKVDAPLSPSIENTPEEIKLDLVTNVKATIAKLNENINPKEKPSAPMEECQTDRSFEEIHQERRNRILSSSRKEKKFGQECQADNSPLKLMRESFRKPIGKLETPSVRESQLFTTQEDEE